MERTKLHQSFALNNCGDLVSIRDVDNGKACGCHCPGCGEHLIARQGQINTWHFAHCGSDCASGAESALHLAAKQIILREARVWTPEIIESATIELKDGRRGEGVATLSAEDQILREVQSEVSMGAIRPDIIAETATGKLMIEIAVSHFVDNKKQSLIEERGIAALEIFIDPIDFSEWSWGSLTQSVLDDRYNRIWIYHPAVHALKAVAEQKAKISAESESLPQWRPPPKKLILFLWGHKIHITDYSWGFTLWYQYDNDIYRVIKDIAKIHGGRWTPQYRNWTFAPGVRMKVEDELRDVGACR